MNDIVRRAAVVRCKPCNKERFAVLRVQWCGVPASKGVGHDLHLLS